MRIDRRMLRKVMAWFSFRRGPDRFLKYPEGKRIYRDFHSIRNAQMDPDGLKVINRLNRYGYKSYFVGGCIRDLLLGKKPKDFDIVTNATPTQLRKLFSNSRVIGRRFKLVHVVFRAGKIIEVSTFRSLPEHRMEGARESDDLYMKRDNIFGTPKEDVARRDFTINSLYFDPRNESIIDYTGGFEDMQNKKVNVIGDPDISFKEDPVRMLRAAKFAPLLGFEMAPACVKGIRKNSEEIHKANANRLLEEYFKIFRTGKAARIFASMYDTGLLSALMPAAVEATRDGLDASAPFESTPLGKRLAIADRMLAEREDLTVDIYLALLFTDLVRDVFAAEHWDREEHVAEYVKHAINGACSEMQLPGRDRSRLLQVFISQIRFGTETDPRRRNRRTDAFREKVYFYESFMVFKIHSLAEGDDEAVQRAMFWEIGPRSRPPDSHRLISIFYSPARHRIREEDRERARGGDTERGGDRGRRGDRERGPTRERGADRERGAERERDSAPGRDTSPGREGGATREGGAVREGGRNRRRRSGRDRRAGRERGAEGTEAVVGAETVDQEKPAEPAQPQPSAGAAGTETSGSSGRRGRGRRGRGRNRNRGGKSGAEGSSAASAGETTEPAHD